MKQEQEEKIDYAAVDELYLYAMNDAGSYQSTHEPYVKNYTGKVRRIVYDENLALRGIVNNYVPMVIDNYRAEHGLGKINKATKAALGKELLREIMSCVDWRLKNEKPE